jgi:monoamine oxidase
MSSRFDVVVVGGGLAGLAAARALETNGIDPVVLEARDRVGGKTSSTRTVYGDFVEDGGQWVGADQERVLSLVDEFDLETRPQYGSGDVVRRVNGERYVDGTYEDTLRALPDESEAELYGAFEEIDRCCEQLPRDEPQSAPNAETWDSMTLETWIDRWFETADGRASFECTIPGIYTAEPSDISFLFFLYYARTAGGFSMLDGRSEELDSHGDVVVDVQGVAEALARDLDHGVEYGHPVRRITQDEDAVRVETPGGPFEGRYAVVALPPTLAGRIDYDPPLPAGRDELVQRMPNGDVVKCNVRYEEPFWRAAGYAGIAEDDEGPVNYFFDDSVPGGETGRIVGFLCGAAARRWADETAAARRDAVTDQLRSLFEDDRFTTPVDYLDTSWTAERYSRGGYHGYPTPGTMVACWDALREPVDRIHWAGAETATKWYGHMDGAIRSGERAAGEIAERIG